MSNTSQRESQLEGVEKRGVPRVVACCTNYFEKLLRQELPACLSPVPSIFYAAFFFFILTVVAIPLGAALFWQTLENTEVVIRYDNFQLMDSQPLTNEGRLEIIRNSTPAFSNNYSVRITEALDSPVYVYYEISDFFQNHKRYVRSLSSSQMGGNDVDSDDLSECDPFRFERTADARPDEESVIRPCGLVAHSFFNDTFILASQMDADGDDLSLIMEETGIATDWDRRYLYADLEPMNFNDVPDLRGGGEINGNLTDDEHFMVWMRVGSMPTIRKLYGIIHDDIPEGANLTFNITNRYNTYDFGGEKRLILSTSNWTGGRNEVTGIIYFVIGSCSAIACILILGMDLKSNRRPGDLTQLSWNN